MYEVFYGLKERPFSLLPDPSYLYLSEKHQMALSLLEYSLVNQAGFCVISGVTGAGKTTLIRHLLNQFGDNLAVGLITNTHQSFTELLRWILMAFSLDYSSDSKPRLYQTFVNFLIEQYAKNRNTVLIVDEAQNMSVDTLEELRMLSNINSDKDQVLQIILVGQPGLRAKLSRPDLEQFAQRIAVDYHIDPLNAEETRNYIRHRLSIAGGDPELFEHDAAQSLYRYSNGIPRLINLLCESALVYGYAEGLTRISARLVEEVARERQAHGLLPHLSAESGHTDPRHSEVEREASGTKNAMHPPMTDTAPSHSGLPLSQTDDRGQEAKHANTTHHNSSHPNISSENIERSFGGGCAPNRNESRLSLETLLPDLQEAETEDSMPVVAMTQGDTARARHAGVTGKLVHLDAWPRSVTDSSHANRPGQRSEGQLQPSSVSDRAPPPAEPTQVTMNSEDSTQPTHDGVPSTDSPHDLRDEIARDNQAGALAAVEHEDRDMSQDTRDSKYRTAGIGASGKWIVATSLGFSGGLLVAVALFVMTYFFKTGHLATGVSPPLTELSSSSVPATGISATAPTASAESSLSSEQALLESLQRERDAAIAQTRALERERDAALAASKVRELTSAAELGVARAREREKAANLAAMRAQERARTAELEATVARERERAASLSATNAQVSKSPVEPKPAPPVEAAVTAPATKVAEEVQPEPKVAAPAEKTVANESPVKFSANPCKGPSAKFLSTCKE